MEELKVFKISERASLPQLNGSYYDLRSAYDVSIPARDRKEIYTDLTLFIPEGYVARVCSRYRLALKNKIFGVSGVIDSRFTGNVSIVLFNNNDNEFKIWKGDRIAFFCIEKIYTLPMVEVKKKLQLQKEVSN